LAAAAAPLVRASAVVLRRPGARPPLAWLGALVPEAQANRVVLVPAWREDSSTLVHVFAADGSTPVAVAKVGADEREHEALASVAATARVAGVDVPEALALGRVGAAPVLVVRAVAGRPLSREPARLDELVERLSAWLEAWNEATCVPRAFSPEEVRARLLEPVRELAPHLPDPARYEAWLDELCGRLEPIPAVAAHNDLTTANVLVGPAGRLAVVDWEAARARDLPLRDLAYSTVDACLAGGRLPSREAVLDEFFAGGDATVRLGRLLAVHRAALGLGRPATVACFHACWLEHARNDLRRAGPDGEFVRIAARLAGDPDRTAKRIAP